MSYPVLSRPKAEEYVLGRRSGTITEGPPEHELRGLEDDYFDEVVHETLQSVLDKWQAAEPSTVPKSARDGVTGALSVELYKGLRDLPGNILSDRDFWRYCAAFLYDIVQWRFGENCQLANYGAAADSVRDCLPHDMFQRAHITYIGGEASGDPDPYALASLSSSDVWRSHILRVLTGNAPLVARALLIDVRDGKLPSDPVRILAKRLKRARANLLFELLDQPQARELVDVESERAIAELELNKGTLAKSSDSDGEAD